MKSSLDTIFYKIMYHHIIYMCDFFREFRWPFVMICSDFHECLVSTRYVPFFSIALEKMELSYLGYPHSSSFISLL